LRGILPFEEFICAASANVACTRKFLSLVVRFRCGFCLQFSMRRKFAGFFCADAAPFADFAAILFFPARCLCRLSARCASEPLFLRLALLHLHKISPLLEPKSLKKADFCINKPKNSRANTKKAHKHWVCGLLKKF